MDDFTTRTTAAIFCFILFFIFYYLFLSVVVQTRLLDYGQNYDHGSSTATVLSELLDFFNATAEKPVETIGQTFGE